MMESNENTKRIWSPAADTENPDTIKQLNQKVMQFGESHIRNVWERRVPAFQMKADKAAGLLDYEIEDEPKDIDTILKVIDEHVVGNGIQTSHGGQFGFISGGGIYAAALADYIAAVTNRYAGKFEASPGAVRIENMLISWVANLIGYSTNYAGNLTSGGSSATLLAVVAARHNTSVKGRDFERLVIYVSEEFVHICIKKALNTAGLFEAIIRNVPTNEDCTMNVDKLRTWVETDKKAGLLPFMIVGTLGTTAVGSVDPIDQMADVAEEFNVWFHVDAAYGGFFVLVDELKHHFKGLHRADSVVIDPHKGLFLPFGIGMVIMKRGQTLRDANSVDGDMPYLQDLQETDITAESPSDFSFELTKHFRGMRMWLPLQLFGVKTFRACLEEMLRLTRYFYTKLTELPGIVVDMYPQLTIITFHYETGKEDENKRVNMKLIEKIKEDGSVHLSSTTIRGLFRLRVCLLHYRCTQDNIDDFIEVLSDTLRKLHCC